MYACLAKRGVSSVSPHLCSHQNELLHTRTIRTHHPTCADSLGSQGSACWHSCCAAQHRMSGMPSGWSTCSSSRTYLSHGHGCCQWARVSQPKPHGSLVQLLIIIWSAGALGRCGAKNACSCSRRTLQRPSSRLDGCTVVGLERAALSCRALALPRSTLSDALKPGHARVHDSNHYRHAPCWRRRMI